MCSAGISAKACSGHCMAGACSRSKDYGLWIAAASAGRIALFSQTGKASLTTIRQQKPVYSAVSDFQDTLEQACGSHIMDQLLLVGSSTDLSWLHAILPQQAAPYITAEIEYPLVSGWFTESPPLIHLREALERLLPQ